MISLGKTARIHFIVNSLGGKGTRKRERERRQKESEKEITCVPVRVRATCAIVLLKCVGVCLCVVLCCMVRECPRVNESIIRSLAVSPMLLYVRSLSCVLICKHVLSDFRSICFSHTHTYIYTHTLTYTARSIKNQKIHLPLKQPPRTVSSSPPLLLPPPSFSRPLLLPLPPASVCGCEIMCARVCTYVCVRV